MLLVVAVDSVAETALDDSLQPMTAKTTANGKVSDHQKDHWNSDVLRLFDCGISVPSEDTPDMMKVTGVLDLVPSPLRPLQVLARLAGSEQAVVATEGHKKLYVCVHCRTLTMSRDHLQGQALASHYNLKVLLRIGASRADEEDVHSDNAVNAHQQMGVRMSLAFRGQRTIQNKGLRRIHQYQPQSNVLGSRKEIKACKAILTRTALDLSTCDFGVD